MDSYIIPPPLLPSLSIHGRAERFPLRRIWCVGRNYAEHAREMGHNPERDPPFFFQKPSDAVVPSGSTIPFPMGTQDLHHEIEMAVLIGKGGQNISEEDALDHVYGYALALDMTRRDLQSIAKKLQRPWEMGKSFDQSCPIGTAYPANEIGHIAKGIIRLQVNGVTRQEGDLADRIWGTAETIAFLSNWVSLAPGDIILTGTPAGVGPCQPGDSLYGSCAGVGDLHIKYHP